MENKKRYNFNDYYEGFLYILAAICFVYFLYKGDQAKTFQAVLIVLVLSTIRVLSKVIKIYDFFALRFSILTFVFVAMFLANEFGFYSIIPRLDKIEHLFSGVILTFVGVVVLKHINRKEKNLRIHPATIVFFSLYFSIAMAGIWEIYEFTTDSIFGLKSQNESLFDTMIDIICGTTGAIAGSIYVHFKAQRKEL